jgi:hypothetical protein
MGPVLDFGGKRFKFRFEESSHQYKALIGPVTVRYAPKFVQIEYRIDFPATKDKEGIQIPEYQQNHIFNALRLR